MSIKNKILVTFLSLAIIAALSVTAFNYFSARKILLRNTTKQLEALTDLKSNKIETFFDDLKGDVTIVQDAYNTKLNFPVMNQLSNNRKHPEFIKAKGILTAQLRKWLKI